MTDAWDPALYRQFATERTLPFEDLLSLIHPGFISRAVDLGCGSGELTRMVAERMGVARSTYFKVEKGDPTVSMGVYAMTLFVLGFGEVLGEIIDVRQDDQGHLLDTARLPERVRTRKTAKPL